MLLFFFFFKQKTAYEMRISDWSSDVCSSDLAGLVAGDRRRLVVAVLVLRVDADAAGPDVLLGDAGGLDRGHHLVHLRGVGGQRGVGVGGLGHHAGRQRRHVRPAAGLGLGRDGEQRASAGGNRGGLGLGVGGHGHGHGRAGQGGGGGGRGRGEGVGGPGGRRQGGG